MKNYKYAPPILGLLSLVFTFALGATALGATALGATASHGRQEQPQPLFQYLSPGPNAELVSAETTIAFRPNPAVVQERSAGLIETLTVTVEGGRSGRHAGRLILGGDSETIIFRPDRPFSDGERVTVSIDVDGVERPIAYQYSFTVSGPKPVVDEAGLWLEAPVGTAETRLETADPLPLYRTAPPDFPTLDVYTAPGTGDDYVFLSHFNYSHVSNGKAYLLMLGENGEPVYYNRLHPLLAAFDFKKQPNGLLTYFDAAQKIYYAMDETYAVAGSYQTGNGYATDLHDMQVIENNHALLLSYDYQIIDMSVIVPGGNPAALVIGCIVQEIDGQGNVIFEWRSWDHIPITDSNQDLTADEIRYIHCNSIEKDMDGHLLVSSRHLDEVTKINRQTGEIIWRLGGKGNQFTFTNDPGFFYQHDARRLGNGRLSVYDNRNHQEPLYSRAVEYVLDEVNLTATRVYEYRRSPDIYGGAMGNYQRLPGGNVMVGWGWASAPMLTEALADGTTVFELSAEENFGTYRAFRFPWEGYPTWPPKLLGYAEGNTVHLFFSYNGATEIVAYKIYGDMNETPTTYIGDAFKDGFENSFTFEAPTDGVYYFRVMPVYGDGEETQYSNTLPVYIGGSPVFLPVIVP